MTQVQLSTSYYEHDDASLGPLKPGDVGTLIQIKAAYKPYRVQAENGDRWWYKKEAIVRQNAKGIPDAVSHACLGAFEDGREGVVRSTTKLERVGLSSLNVIEVASVHDGRACLYAAEDLMFADGLTSEVSRIPMDWGIRHLAKVEVSTNVIDTQNLIDGDPSTYWEVQQNSQQYILLFLKKPRNVKDLWLIIDEADCSHDGGIYVKVKVGEKRSTLTTQPLPNDPPDGSKGPKQYCVLKDCRQTRVSVIKIELEGAKRIRGLAITVKESHLSFRVGDRVKLHEDYVKPGFGWNLQNGNEGIVTCIPKVSFKHEQRALIVSSLRNDEHYFFRSSQLQPADSNRRFELGAFVQLNAKGWDARYRSMECKCLGHPREMLRGMVTDLGVARDGIQRNIEITRSDINGQTRRSLYPAVVLLPFSPFSMLSDSDRTKLIVALSRIVAKANESIKVESLVDMWGLESWSKIWQYISEQIGQQAVFSEFAAWQKSRASELTVEKFIERLKEPTHLSNELQLGVGGPKPTWNCEKCGFSNNTGLQGKCSICGPWKGPWTCNICLSRNSSFQSQCNTCSKYRGCLDLDHASTISSTWLLWSKEAEKEAALALAKEKLRIKAKEEKETNLEKGGKPQDVQKIMSNLDDDVSASSADEDEHKVDSDMEADLNENLASSIKERPTQVLQKAMRNIMTFHKISSGVEYFRPILDLNSLIRWRDSGDNNAAHHLAYMGLHRTLKVLYDNGAFQWSRNRLGETPAALSEGLIGYEKEKYNLHQYITLGNLLGLEQFESEMMNEKQVRSEVLGRVMHCPRGHQIEEIFLPIKAKLLSGNANSALELLRELLGRKQSSRHQILAHLYTALSFLEEGYGAKTARFELVKYLAKLAQSVEPVFDPVYFYVLYRMWVLDSRPKSKKLFAACSLMAFRCFDCSSDWPLEDDSFHLDISVNNVTVELNSQVDVQDEGEPLGPEDPETEWLLAQKRHGIKSESIDKLMALTGLKSVKKSAIYVVKDMLLREGRPQDINTDLCMNFLFVGNPGSGKTTAAKLLAEGMSELGFRKDLFQETSAVEILKKQSPVGYFSQLVQRATGGVIFIDEAYRFTPARAGSQPNDSNYVLDYLLEAVEDKTIRKSTTFILAGYKDEMESLLSYNVGFASRFPHEFNFEDFNEVQIRSILLGMIKERGLQLESKIDCNIPLAKVVAQRVARYANKKGFGNARAVRNQVDEIVSNQTQRLGTKKMRGEPVSLREYRVLTRNDAIGPRPNLASSVLVQELNSLVGLSKVKLAVRKLVDLQMRNYDREIAGERPELISLHRVFYGNPGDS